MPMGTVKAPLALTEADTLFAPQGVVDDDGFRLAQVRSGNASLCRLS